MTIGRAKGFLAAGPREPTEVRSLVELLYETYQPRVVKVRQLRLIECRAAEQACIPLANLLANRRVSASDCVGIHHLIGDQVVHTLPVPVLCLTVQVTHAVLPACPG